jgi:hypothetical protein
MTVAKDMSKYELELMGIHEARWDRDGKVSPVEMACSLSTLLG